MLRRLAVACRRLRRLGGAVLCLAIMGGSAVEIHAAAALRAAIGSLRSRIVVIDPGHGGIDPGAVGAYGHQEDEIVTPISEDLARLLERAGAIVVMTRRHERLGRRLPMPERIDRLLAAGGDVLVSIHANKFFLASAHGATVIYSPKSQASRRLARLLQDEFITLTRETQRPLLSRDNLYVLNHSPVPAVIVEVGFLSNAREARLLAQQAYQQRLAWAMFVGLAKWFAMQVEPPAPPKETAGNPRIVSVSAGGDGQPAEAGLQTVARAPHAGTGIASRVRRQAAPRSGRYSPVTMSSNGDCGRIRGPPGVISAARGLAPRRVPVPCHPPAGRDRTRPWAPVRAASAANADAPANRGRPPCRPEQAAPRRTDTTDGTDPESGGRRELEARKRTCIRRNTRQGPFASTPEAKTVLPPRGLSSAAPPAAGLHPVSL